MTARIVPYISRLLRQRDALIALLDRLELFADHRPKCPALELTLEQCRCGYGEIADDLAVLKEGIRVEARPAFPAAVGEGGE